MVTYMNNKKKKKTLQTLKPLTKNNFSIPPPAIDNPLTI